MHRLGCAIGARAVGEKSVRGFTLIEMLVAVAVLAVAATLSYSAMDQFHAGAKHMEESSDRWRQLTGLFARLQLDFARTPRFPIGHAPAWLATVHADGHDELRLVRLGEALSNARAGPRQVALRWRAGMLEYRSAPVLSRDMGQPLWVLERVAAMRLQFLDSLGRWNSQWPAQPGPYEAPRAVAIEFDLEDLGRIRRVFVVT